MPSRLKTRLRRLEARRAAAADPPYTPPEPPPGWYEEVLRLLRVYGYLDETIRSWGLTGFAQKVPVAQKVGSLHKKSADFLRQFRKIVGVVMLT
jgi:hypothetical protein